MIVALTWLYAQINVTNTTHAWWDSAAVTILAIGLVLVVLVAVTTRGSQPRERPPLIRAALDPVVGIFGGVFGGGGSKAKKLDDDVDEEQEEETDKE